MYVKTDYDGCPYVTAGKPYHIHVELNGFLFVIDDDGCLISCMDKDNSDKPQNHLGGIGTWIICDKEGNEL
jgi:hypothetical protein